MAKFTKIGTAEKTLTKKGKQALHLFLDPTAQTKLMNHDFHKGIWVFKSETTPAYYSVMVAMPDDYEINYDAMAKKWVDEFTKKHQEDTKENFSTWLEK